MPKRDEQLRLRILKLVEEYYQERFASRSFDPDTDTIHYAGRVFNADELVKLVDSSLDFFLTASRYSDQFEDDISEFFGLFLPG